MQFVLGSCLLFVCAIAIFASRPRAPDLFVVLLLSFLTRALAGLANDLVFHFYGYEYTSDWYLFHLHATDMYLNGGDSVFAGFRTGRFFFAWLAGLLYLFSGPGTFLVVCINVVLGTVSVYAAYRLSHLLWDDHRWATLSAAVVGATPTLILHS